MINLNVSLVYCFCSRQLKVHRDSVFSYGPFASVPTAPAKHFYDSQYFPNLGVPFKLGNSEYVFLILKCCVNFHCLSVIVNVHVLNLTLNGAWVFKDFSQTNSRRPGISFSSNVVKSKKCSCSF